MSRPADPVVLEDIRKNLGQIGYPGGCPTCKGLVWTNPGHRLPQGPDTITCIACGEEGKSAYHNHVICKECGG